MPPTDNEIRSLNEFDIVKNFMVGIGGRSGLNEYDRLNDVLNHVPVDRPPVICPMHAATAALMRCAGCHESEVLDNPVKMARMAIAVHDKAGFENVRVPFDESVEVSAFGVITGHKSAQRLPIVLQRIISSPSDVDDLRVPDPRTEGRVPHVLEAVRRLETEWQGSEEVPIFIGITSPLMLAMQLRGDHEVLLDMDNEPELLRALLGKTTNFIVEYLRAAVEVGVDQIVVDDSLSNSEVLTFNHFHEFAEPYEDRIANEMRRLDIESIMHLCGRISGEQLERMVEIDVDALSIDEEVPIPILRGMAESRGMAIIGNVSPTTTLLMGSASNVEKETRRCIDEGIDAVAPGGSLEMYTPMENIVMMTRTAKRYGAEHHRQTMR